MTVGPSRLFSETTTRTVSPPTRASAAPTASARKPPASLPVTSVTVSGGSTDSPRSPAPLVQLGFEAAEEPHAVLELREVAVVVVTRELSPARRYSSSAA